jgi:hypothetical protein
VGRRTGLLAVAFGAIATPVLIVVDELRSASSDFQTGLAGLAPVAAVAVLVAGFVVALRRGAGVPKEETIQAVVLVLASALVVFTVTGVWFRGEGMALVWPWMVP